MCAPHRSCFLLTQGDLIQVLCW